MSHKDADPRETTHDFLKKHPVAILSTSSADGQPWGSAVYYVADNDFNFYFVTRTGTQKYKNMLANPKVSLTVAEEDSQKTVQVAGTLTKVPADDYAEVVFHELASLRSGDGTWAPPIDKIHSGDYVALKLTPSTLQYADYGQQKSDPRANYIEQII